MPFMGILQNLLQCVTTDFYLLFKMLYGKFVLYFVNRVIIISSVTQLNYPLLICLYIKNFRALFVLFSAFVLVVTCFFFYFISSYVTTDENLSEMVPAQAQLKYFTESCRRNGFLEMVLKALYSTGCVYRLKVVLQMF